MQLVDTGPPDRGFLRFCNQLFFLLLGAGGIRSIRVFTHFNDLRSHRVQTSCLSPSDNVQRYRAPQKLGGRPFHCIVRTFGVRLRNRLEISPMANAETVKQDRHPHPSRHTRQAEAGASCLSTQEPVEFVLGQALHAADEVIHEHETLTLNKADWGVFLNALENRPSPAPSSSGPLPNTRNASGGKGHPLGPHYRAARQTARAGVLRLRRRFPQPIPAPIRQPGRQATVEAGCSSPHLQTHRKR